MGLGLEVMNEAEELRGNRKNAETNIITKAQIYAKISHNEVTILLLKDILALNRS